MIFVRLEASGPDVGGEPPDAHEKVLERGHINASQLSRSLVGSVTDQVVWHARYPVTVIGPPGSSERAGFATAVFVDGGTGV